MIYCISCEKYPKNQKEIPSGSKFLSDAYRVKLISADTPSTLPVNGSDVENLANDTVFSVGSLLYIVEGSDGSEVYVFVDGGFELWDSPIPIDF